MRLTVPQSRYLLATGCLAPVKRMRFESSTSHVMEVEWIGGPNDGSLIDMPEDAECVNILYEGVVYVVPVCFNPQYKYPYHAHFPYHLVGKGGTDGVDAE